MSFLSASLSVFEEASVPITPVSPNRNLNITIGAFLGLLGGLGLALLLTNLDSTLYTLEEIETASGAPIVAQIPVNKIPENKRPRDALTDGSLPQDEAFRRLRIQLLNQMADLPKALMISSAQPSEGQINCGNEPGDSHGTCGSLGSGCRRESLDATSTRAFQTSEQDRSEQLSGEKHPN
jgi:hypothetical protein